MGQKNGRTTRSAASAENPFKLFDYQCPNCDSKRPIQYFYRNGVFLPQAPRVVCGECSTSVLVEPFKTVDHMCPWCKKWHKSRLPAKPIPLNMYNISVVSCNCGFRGEVPVGRLMDVACSQCWSHKRELRSIWAEDGDEVKTFCDGCQDYQRAFARAPQKKTAAESVADMEYNCENCFRIRPIESEALLRNRGLAVCSLCGWVGYPEVLPKGQLKAKSHDKMPQAPGRDATARASSPGKARTGGLGDRAKKVRPSSEKAKTLPLSSSPATDSILPSALA